MRILILSNAPWVPTGYGRQAALAAPRIQKLGHEVAIAAYWGLAGATIEWEGIPVFPAAWRPNQHGLDMIDHWYQEWNADLLIILADAWVGAGYLEKLGRIHVANWMPVDAYPLSRRDFGYLVGSGAWPIAMSRFGERMLGEAGFRPLYVPHGIDTSVFAPYQDSADRDAQRTELELTPDTFVIGMNAANRDLHRKGFFEQFTAFAQFHERHPDSRLYVHTTLSHPGGLDVVELTRSCGISDAVIFPDQGPLGAGQIDDRALVRNFYHLLDAYSGCSLGEGFGIPIVEAQACGLPVAVTDASAMTELCAPGGQLVRGEPLWVEGHQARWTKPSIEGIAQAYETLWHYRAEGALPELATAARELAVRYDADRVADEYWTPALAELETRCA